MIFERIAEELVANGFEVAQMGPAQRWPFMPRPPESRRPMPSACCDGKILDGTERENSAISMDSLQGEDCRLSDFLRHAAIKVNMPLDQTKMEWLLAELAKTEAPMSCPHGRPIVLRYSVREIERAFKRI